MIGESLNHYRIEALLGAGGMGEVYEAKDTKLGRSVALKVLPDAVARNSDRISRFHREAKLLAALNHPNVGALYGMEEAGGRHFLVMELIDGETLAERLRRGALPVVEALQIAHQIVEALEAAHEKGIVHRDLKPANVKITRDGKVKVLDFGLAKAMESPSTTGSQADVFSNSPTISIAATNAGIILGTAAYMSPEQANGHAADARSDLFSLGSVLYEMLTGRQPFQGKTLSEVLASVLVRDPDWSGLPPNLNPRIHELIRRCLEKEPKRRWHAAGDVRVEIERLLADPDGSQTLPPLVAQKPLWKRAVPVLVAAVVAAVLASIGTWFMRPSPPNPVVTRFPFVLPQDQVLNPFNVAVAISPDGTRLAYVESSKGIFLRRMSEMEARLVPGTVGAGTPIFFSPDGDWIGFWSFTEAALKKIAVTGGAPLLICKGGQPLGVYWEGDKIIWSDSTRGILRVSEGGGEPEVLVRPDPGELLHAPQILDSGKAVLFTSASAGTPEGWDTAQIVVQPLPSGKRKVILRGGSDARVLPTGHLVYGLGANILAVPFDLAKLETQSSAVVVVEGVNRPFASISGAANIAISKTGMLAYVPGGAAGSLPTVLAFVDRQGRTESVPLPPDFYSFPRLSPDEKQIAYQRDDGKSTNVWIYERSGGRAPRKLTFDDRSGIPVWSPDGRRLIFITPNGSLAWQVADGTQPAEPLTKAEQGTGHLPQSVNAVTKVLAFTVSRGTVGGISFLELEGERKLQPFAGPPGQLEIHADFSRDGRWLAFMSLEKNTGQIFVRSYPAGARYQVTTTGGVYPLWSPDGRQLFYVSNSKLFVVDVQTEPSFSVGPPTELPITGAIHPAIGMRNYDITKDGRFLVVLPAAAPGNAQRSAAQIDVVLNWFEELQQRVRIP